jgi:hypothetical protein
VNSPNGTRNPLLAMMSSADRDRLAPNIETIELDVRQILEAPGEVISHVYFVENGLVSIVGTAPQGHRIEIGMVGCEGMSGVSSWATTVHLMRPWCNLRAQRFAFQLVRCVRQWRPALH